MQRVFNFLTGALIGSVVGATIAILLAPASGEELRAQMQERAQTLQTEVKSAAAARRAELEKQLAAMREPRHS
ncbi:MAG: YtxH domain-containing protein [Chloroflexota bacterium]|nr:MAG: YtxH domain-containing protein [Chloroflexota bacterium]